VLDEGAFNRLNVKKEAEKVSDRGLWIYDQLLIIDEESRSHSCLLDKHILVTLEFAGHQLNPRIPNSIFVPGTLGLSRVSHRGD